MPRIRSRRRAGILAATAAALAIAAIASPAAAWAAPAPAAVAPAAAPAPALVTPVAAPAHQATVALDAPAGATTAWIEFEQSGLAPASLEVAARLDGGPWRTVDLTATTFGLHGELSIGAGRLEVSVEAAPGFPASTPDAALTILDGSGAVVASSSRRLTVPALPTPGPSGGGSDPAAVSVVPADGQSPATAARGGLAATGGPDPLAPLSLALATLLLGGAALVLRTRIGAARRSVRTTQAGA